MHTHTHTCTDAHPYTSLQAFFEQAQTPSQGVITQVNTACMHTCTCMMQAFLKLAQLSTAKRPSCRPKRAATQRCWPVCLLHNASGSCKHTPAWSYACARLFTCAVHVTRLAECGSCALELTAAGSRRSGHSCLWASSTQRGCTLKGAQFCTVQYVCKALEPMHPYVVWRVWVQEISLNLQSPRPLIPYPGV